MTKSEKHIFNTFKWPLCVVFFNNLYLTDNNTEKVILFWFKSNTKIHLCKKQFNKKIRMFAQKAMLYNKAKN